MESELASERHVQVMAGNGLVEDGGLEVRLRPERGVRQVHMAGATPAAVRGGAGVVGGSTTAHTHHGARRRWQSAEPAGCLAERSVEGGGRGREHRSGARQAEARVVAQPRPHLGRVIHSECRGAQPPVLVVEPCQLLAA